jgi:predicted nucleotidyltransferase
MGIEELIGRRREEILRIASHHGARNVRVFGSVARGDAKATSDLDLLIEAGPNLTPWFPGGLVSDLEELLGRHVDVVTEQALHPAMRDRVLREAVPV